MSSAALKLEDDALFLDEPQSLHLLLQSEYPDLYHLAFPQPSVSMDSRPHTPEHIFGTEPASKHVVANQEHRPDCLLHLQHRPNSLQKDSDCYNGQSSSIESHPSTNNSFRCPEWVRRLLNGADLVYRRHVARLRAEAHDLTRQMRCLQKNCDFANKELKRMKKERTTLRLELATQVSRYEHLLEEFRGVVTCSTENDFVKNVSRFPCRMKQLAPDGGVKQIDRSKYEINNSNSSQEDSNSGESRTGTNADPQNAEKTSKIARNISAYHPMNLLNSLQTQMNESHNTTCNMSQSDAKDKIQVEYQIKCLIEEQDISKRQLETHVHTKFENPSKNEETNKAFSRGWMKNSSLITKRESAEQCLMLSNIAKPLITSSPKRCQSEWIDDNPLIPTNDAHTETNVYDLPEPLWLTEILKQYNEWIDPYEQNLDGTKFEHNHQSNTIGENLSPFDQAWTGSMLGGPFSPNALLRFLNGLAKLAPYPRLVDVAHCASLTWSRLLTTLGRMQADCVVLQTNVAEIKATAERMQCHMNQIDANFGAALRANQLADISLELYDSLSQLYASELAIVLRHICPKRSKVNMPCSNISSSTSSSSFNCSHGTKTKLKSTGHGHVYAVYAKHSGNEVMCDTQNSGVRQAHSAPVNLHTLEAYRTQVEHSAQMLLDRFDAFEQSCGKNDTILHAPTYFEKTPVNVPPNPAFPSPRASCSQSVISSSLYANSWYVSLGRNENLFRNTTTSPSHTEQLSNCSANGSTSSQHKITSSLRNPAKNVPANATYPIVGGGWQTPDSGAGSCSTANDVSQQHLQLQAFLNSNPWVGIGNPNECNPCHCILDQYSPIWTYYARDFTARLMYDTDSDSSDSSCPDEPASNSVRKRPSLIRNGNFLEGSSWSRVEERRMRNLLNQFIHARRLARSSIIDTSLYTTQQSSEPGDLVKQPWELKNSVDSSIDCIFGKIPLSLLQENAVVIQELYSVKEERAELNARVYLLEKEVQANRVALTSRLTLETIRKAQVEALMEERNSLMDGMAESNSSRTENLSYQQQFEKLLHALETFRQITETQQSKNEELINDLKQANAALIEAFEKVKKKYATRIKKLEDQLSEKSTPATRYQLTPAQSSNRMKPTSAVSQIVPPLSHATHLGVGFQSMQNSRPLPAVPPEEDGQQSTNYSLFSPNVVRNSVPPLVRSNHFPQAP